MYPFLKGHGTENDFVLLPDHDGTVHGGLSPEAWSARVRALCDRRADGYRNILQNPHVGLLFMIPGRGDTLRVNGRARLVTDAPFFDEMAVRGARPVLAVVVDVEEVFFHCAKAFLRSGLWQPETWEPEARVPRRAVIASQVEGAGPVEELDAYYGPSYAEGLY